MAIIAMILAGENWFVFRSFQILGAQNPKHLALLREL